MKEKYKEVLVQFVPERSVDLIAEWIIQFNFDLRITRDRSTKLGDFRNATSSERHKISVNHNLNPFAFLITLVHEIAHLTCWEKHKWRVKPHGEEWKSEFKKLMHHFFFEDIFPDDVRHALQRYMMDPAASSCSDTHLQRILKKYDREHKSNNYILLEQLPVNAKFVYNEKRIFVKGPKMRKRFKCTEVDTKRVYLFSPLAEVEAAE